jgi:hypothetical protein
VVSFLVVRVRSCLGGRTTRSRTTGTRGRSGGSVQACLYTRRRFSYSLSSPSAGATTIPRRWRHLRHRSPMSRLPKQGSQRLPDTPLPGRRRLSSRHSCSSSHQRPSRPRRPRGQCPSPGTRTTSSWRTRRPCPHRRRPDHCTRSGGTCPAATARADSLRSLHLMAPEQSSLQSLTTKPCRRPRPPLLPTY